MVLFLIWIVTGISISFIILYLSGNYKYLIGPGSNRLDLGDFLLFIILPSLCGPFILMPMGIAFFNFEFLLIDSQENMKETYTPTFKELKEQCRLAVEADKENGK